LLASFALFFAAHALLFRLYLPSRYAQHSVRIALALAAGIVLTVLAERAVDLLRPRLGDRRHRQRWVVAGVGGAALAGVLFAPTASWLAEGELPEARYRRADAPPLYEFLRRQPKSTLVASVSDVADFIPPLALRSVVVSPKYTLPYHTGYFEQMEERARDLIRAQYSPDLHELQEVTREYGADYWLVRRTAFTPSYIEESWIMDVQPEATEARDLLMHGVQPAMARVMDRCAAFTTSNLIVVDADCILSREAGGRQPVPGH
jgi:hypothetical protein